MEFKIIITEEDIKKYPNDYDLGEYVRKMYHQFLDLRAKDIKTKINENSDKSK